MHDPMMKREHACFEKANANGEDIFTVRSQDLLAPLTVTFWAHAQRYLEDAISKGLSPMAALNTIAQRLDSVFSDRTTQAISWKVSDAYQIADAMRVWPGEKKVAD